MRSTEKKVVYSALGLVVAGFMAGCNEIKAETNKTSAASAPQAPISTVVPRHTTSSPSDVVTGTLTPVMSLDLGFEVGGKLKAIRAQKGAKVKTGQVLGQLDPEIADAQIAQAQAGLAAAEAASGLAEEMAKRNTELKADGTISEVENLSSQTTSRQASAQVLMAKAQLSQAVAARKRHDLRAPFEATVVNAPTQIGGTIAPGMPVFSLQQVDTLVLKTTVSEDVRDAVHVGTKVRVDSVGSNASTHEAVVTLVLPSADPVTRRIPVEISVPNKDARFLANSLASVRLPLGKAVEAQIIPATALARIGGEHVLAVEEGKAKRVAVSVVATSGDEVTIIASEPISKVVNHPSPSIKDGTFVPES
ncbi:MAG: efflux RND transporter periplasmic adaptor subunit [Proteobacteria bacterium]|nr:efflux RND transporter periplasmic adaptor subunit [Cystobacterineae bacterium]MCL2258976.1 efflux RND transporter periplasmic adaptor subunit [Cystobacterineae bacterium]MCL2314662.1 efflux RND transporter periplasmic adaptor subunit [Pseudomonadota bacterium]